MAIKVKHAVNAGAVAGAGFGAGLNRGRAGAARGAAQAATQLEAQERAQQARALETQGAQAHDLQRMQIGAEIQAGQAATRQGYAQDNARLGSALQQSAAVNAQRRSRGLSQFEVAPDGSVIQPAAPKPVIDPATGEPVPAGPDLAGMSDLEFALTTRQKVELNQLAEAEAKLMSSSDFTEEEKVEAQRQIAAKRAGVKPVERAREPTPAELFKQKTHTDPRTGAIFGLNDDGTFGRPIYQPPERQATVADRIGAFSAASKLLAGDGTAPPDPVKVQALASEILGGGASGVAGPAAGFDEFGGGEDLGYGDLGSDGAGSRALAEAERQIAEASSLVGPDGKRLPPQSRDSGPVSAPGVPTPSDPSGLASLGTALRQIGGRENMKAATGDPDDMQEIATVDRAISDAQAEANSMRAELAEIQALKESRSQKGEFDMASFVRLLWLSRKLDSGRGYGAGDRGLPVDPVENRLKSLNDRRTQLVAESERLSALRNAKLLGAQQRGQ